MPHNVFFPPISLLPAYRLPCSLRLFLPIPKVYMLCLYYSEKLNAFRAVIFLPVMWKQNPHETIINNIFDWDISQWFCPCVLLKQSSLRHALWEWLSLFLKHETTHFKRINSQFYISINDAICDLAIRKRDKQSPKNKAWLPPAFAHKPTDAKLLMFSFAF